MTDPLFLLIFSVGAGGALGVAIAWYSYQGHRPVAATPVGADGGGVQDLVDEIGACVTFAELNRWAEVYRLAVLRAVVIPVEGYSTSVDVYLRELVRQRVVELMRRESSVVHRVHEVGK